MVEVRSNEVVINTPSGRAAPGAITLTGYLEGNAIMLEWNNPGNVDLYRVEVKSGGSGAQYQSLGTVSSFQTDFQINLHDPNRGNLQNNTMYQFAVVGVQN